MAHKHDFYKKKYYIIQALRYVKYIGIISAFITFYSDVVIFNFLSLLTFFVLVEAILHFELFKAGLFQYVSMITIKLRYNTKNYTYEHYTNEITYTLPFEGKWAIINGSYGKEHSHSWGIQAQRYAYDFIKIDEHGKSYETNPLHLKDYYCYDEALLAPADGKVVKVYNKAKDSIIIDPPKFLSRSNHIAGNYITIQHTNSEFSTLAHLKKDSMLVLEGDQVKRGQKIATCGNTGNSTEPHLHFQLHNTKHFFHTLGLPIKFKNYTLHSYEAIHSIDSRAKIPKGEIKKGYLTRGYLVSNNA